MYDLIIKKKRGGALTKEEITYMVREYTKGTIPDYQMSAMLMAVCFVGMTEEETVNLTLAMAESGDMLDLSDIRGIKVDKHSTGGVGDKTSLVLGPLVASQGIPVAKMSGRGLGHTGGTIDKLESITGFRTDLSREEFIQNVNTIHLAIAGQTANLAPADKKLYALRDVTGTVDQMSLIAGSIMSKKLASGADAIVLDVKTGGGAFMKNESDARALAEEMVHIGLGAGRKTCAVISDMDQPLGYMVGNILEVKEAIDTLKGNGPEDLTELVLVLGSYMVRLAGADGGISEIRERLKKSMEDGSAFGTFCRFVEAQGGDVREVTEPERMKKALYELPVTAKECGYVEAIQTEEVGNICLLLGGGRQTKESTIDPAVGIELKKKKGDPVRTGEVLGIIHANDMISGKEACRRLLLAYTFSGEPVKKEPLMKAVIEE